MKKIFNFEQLHGLENKNGTAIIDYSFEGKTYGDFDVVRVKFFNNPKDNICYYYDMQKRKENLNNVIIEINKFGFELEYQESIILTEKECNFLTIFSNFEYTKDYDGINIFCNKELKALCTGFNSVPITKTFTKVNELLKICRVTKNFDELKEMNIAQLNLTLRSYNILKKIGINNAYDLINADSDKILNTSGCGYASYNNIIDNINVLKSKYFEVV